LNKSRDFKIDLKGFLLPVKRTAALCSVSPLVLVLESLVLQASIRTALKNNQLFTWPNVPPPLLASQGAQANGCIQWDFNRLFFQPPAVYDPEISSISAI